LIARAVVLRNDMARASRSQGPARPCARLVHIRIAPSPQYLPRSDRRADHTASPPQAPLSIAAQLG
jgi:hypothetical protein